MATWFDGIEERQLGCILREDPAMVGAQFPVLSTRIPLIPRSEWREITYKHLIWYLHDQNGIGSCNAEAATETIETFREMMGHPRIKLSPGNLYGRINDGRDQGSMLGDAIKELMDNGVCTAELVEPLAWRQWNTPGWKEEGKRFKILECYDCPDFDSIATAIQLGFFVDYGLLVGDNFKVGPDGWVGDQRGRRGGHAMMGIGLCKRGRDDYGIDTPNSWGENWGNGGFGIVPENYFSGTFTDAWAIRVATFDEEN